MQSNLARKWKHASHREVSVSDIVASFNTWAFKREQPDDVARLQTCVERARRKNRPIEFVTYWGKGPRSRLAAPDVQCLDFLEKMLCKVQGVCHSGARLHLLMTDTHAHLNRHSGESIDRYFCDVEREGRARGFECRRLNDVVVASNISSLEMDEEPPAALLAALSESAGKWYRGAANRETVAREYFRGNMREKKAVETQYPDSIFISFNNSNFRLLFPDSLPIFYMYSLKRGVAVKPWFIGDDERQDGAHPSALEDLHVREAK